MRLMTWISRHANAPDVTFAVAILGIITTLTGALTHLIDAATVTAFVATFGSMLSISGVLNAQSRGRAQPKLPPDAPPENDS